jgi:hypothetical protein
MWKRRVPANIEGVIMFSTKENNGSAVGSNVMCVSCSPGVVTAAMIASLARARLIRSSPESTMQRNALRRRWSEKIGFME